MGKITAEDLKDKIIVSAIKGIIPEFTLIPAAYLNDQFGVEYNNMAIERGYNEEYKRFKDYFDGIPQPQTSIESPENLAKALDPTGCPSWIYLSTNVFNKILALSFSMMFIVQ